MTDNEIIKALECRVKDKCPECPYFHSYPCDKCRNMQTDALDLINRQKAEIEKLKDEYRWLDQESDILQADVENLSRMCGEVNAENENLKAEVERLKSKVEPKGFKTADPMDFCGVLCDFAEGLIAKAKAEAYKEFAEKVKEEISEALKNNYDVRAKRMAKPKVDMADEFISYCEGKIHCLRGLDNFLDDILNEFTKG